MINVELSIAIKLTVNDVQVPITVFAVSITVPNELLAVETPITKSPCGPKSVLAYARKEIS